MLTRFDRDWDFVRDGEEEVIVFEPSECAGLHRKSMTLFASEFGSTCTSTMAKALALARVCKCEVPTWCGRDKQIAFS